jgi:hypothetical protein
MLGSVLSCGTVDGFVSCPLQSGYEKHRHDCADQDRVASWLSRQICDSLRKPG